MMRAVFIVLCAMLWSLPVLAQSPENAAPGQEEKAAVEKAPEPTAADLFRSSDKTWKKRNRKGSIQKSLEFAENALKIAATPKERFGAYWRIARACFWIAEWAKNDDLKEDMGKKGWEAGQEAVKLEPNRVEGYYFGGIALAQYGKAIGVVSAVFKGVSGDYEEALEKAIKIDPKYELAGPTRGYGRYWFKLPAVKRDYNRSAKLLEQSAKDSPLKLRTHFYLAETYLKRDKGDDREKARKALETCVGLDPAKEDYADGILFKPQCKKLLEKEFGAKE